MYESDDEQSKREFYYYESKNNKKNNIENDDCMSRYMYACIIELLHIECVLLYPVSQKSISTKWRIYKGKISTPDTSPSTHSISTNYMVCMYVCKVCCLKSHIINLILTSTAWSSRENIRGRSFTYGLVRTVKTSVWYFPVMTTFKLISWMLRCHPLEKQSLILYHLTIHFSKHC